MSKGRGRGRGAKQAAKKEEKIDEEKETEEVDDACSGVDDADSDCGPVDSDRETKKTPEPSAASNKTSKAKAKAKAKAKTSSKRKRSDAGRKRSFPKSHLVDEWKRFLKQEREALQGKLTYHEIMKQAASKPTARFSSIPKFPSTMRSSYQ